MLGDFSSLLAAMPDCPEKSAFQYSPCKILCVTLSFKKPERRKNKFVVLMDEKEPPLFFIINTKEYGDCCLGLRKEDYSFLDNPVSWLNYSQVSTSIDFVDGLPTKASLLEQLDNDPGRIKGLLRIEDARAILEGIQKKKTNIERKDKNRIIPALENYIQADKP